jgi:hypothetical protein
MNAAQVDESSTTKSSMMNAARISENDFDEWQHDECSTI